MDGRRWAWGEKRPQTPNGWGWDMILRGSSCSSTLPSSALLLQKGNILEPLAIFFESCSMRALVIPYSIGHGAQDCIFILACSSPGFLLTPWDRISWSRLWPMTGRKDRLLFAQSLHHSPLRAAGDLQPFSTKLLKVINAFLLRLLAPSKESMIGNLNFTWTNFCCLLEVENSCVIAMAPAPSS